MTERDEAGWENQYKQSVDRERDGRDAERATGFWAFLVDIKLWAAAVLIPFAAVALGLGWAAERIGWSRWIGVLVAAAATIAILALVPMKRRLDR